MMSLLEQKVDLMLAAKNSVLYSIGVSHHVSVSLGFLARLRRCLTELTEPMMQLHRRQRGLPIAPAFNGCGNLS
jgi:hypothetical protein